MQNGFVRHDTGGTVYYTSEKIDSLNMFRHAFTTRIGGCSTGDFEGLNLAFWRGDDKESVLKNYDIICSALGTDKKRALALCQVHKKSVVTVHKSDCGKRILTDGTYDADALICREKGVLGCVYTADCVPVLIADKKTRAYAAIHSGWRSTVLNICREAAEKMKKEFLSDPSDMICAIGPSIGQCHFEVDGDVADLFEDEFKIKKGDKYYIDLKAKVKSQLVGCGIKEENIDVSDMCTYCMEDEFFSSRRQNGKMGLMAAMIEII